MVETNTINSAGEHVTYDYGDRYSQSDRTDGRKSKGFNSPGKKKGWQVSEMWESHHEIARRILLGETNKDIADSMSLSVMQVSNVRNSPVVKERLSLMGAARDVGCIDLAKDIMDLAPIALKRIREVLEDGTVHGQTASANSILKECNGVLDRHLGKAAQTINTRNLHAHFTSEDLQRIKDKAIELAQCNGHVVEE
jgi:hypothetical protein